LRRNVGIRSPIGALLYPRRTQFSATVLRRQKSSRFRWLYLQRVWVVVTGSVPVCAPCGFSTMKLPIPWCSENWRVSYCVFYVMTPYELVGVYKRFQEAYCRHPQARIEDGSFLFLWNFGYHPQDYTVLLHRRPKLSLYCQENQESRVACKGCWRNVSENTSQGK
jgi:hypothetical protein